jgi:hypothetical protein
MRITALPRLSCNSTDTSLPGGSRSPRYSCCRTGSSEQGKKGEARRSGTYESDGDDEGNDADDHEGGVELCDHGLEFLLRETEASDCGNTSVRKWSLVGGQCVPMNAIPKTRSRLLSSPPSSEL